MVFLEPFQRMVLDHIGYNQRRTFHGIITDSAYLAQS